MLKYIFIAILIFFSVSFSHSEFIYTDDWIILPEEINWTERYILTELKELRIDQETLKREIFADVQARQIDAIDKALSYSANTVNFFFILITIIIAWFWVVWWKTIWDVKKSTKESMDRETKKIIANFQKKIAELEKEQKINIYWRQFNSSDNDKEKMDILDKIHSLRPESQYVIVERSNVYLSMWLYEKVIEMSDIILNSWRTKHQPHALYNRACAYALLQELDKLIADLRHLMQLSPQYKDLILSSDYIYPFLKNPKIKEILKW